MDSNKNQLLLLLRRDNQSLQLELEHVIVILNHNQITLQQARKFTRQRFPVPLDHWTKLEEQDIEGAAQEAAEYIRINRGAWVQREKNYSEQVERCKQITGKVLNILDIQTQPANAELLGLLEGRHGEREQLLKTHMGTESQQSILQENKLIYQLSALLREILSYEQAHRQLYDPSDEHYQQIISKFINDNRQKYTVKLERRKQNERKKVVAKMEDYERKVIVLKKRLYQIFLFYCRENKSVGLTFEDYGRTAQLIDLRLFLIYFKDYKYTDINKFRFKVTTSTQIFRNAATNGLSLSFQQFWQVHRQLFDLRDLNITRRDIIEAEVEELPQILQKWQDEIGKLKQLNDIVNEDRTKELLQFVSLKTENSPERTLIKNSSSVMMESKVTSNLSSKVASNLSGKFSRKKAYSQLEGQLLSSKNFIQRVRAELNNAEDATQRVKMSRYNSLSNLESQRRTASLQINLPKILKLSSKEISSQGIYRSLKNFSDVDYRTQQKKLRDIIGLSNGDDDNLINAYLTKERHDKQQKKRERSLDREQKRRQFLEELVHKQHHCKKYNPSEVQPYMRF